MDISQKVVKTKKDKSGNFKKTPKGDYSTEKYNFGSKTCNLCGGLGIYLVEYVPQEKSEFFVLCECISKNCKCKNKPPYMIYDKEKNSMVDCPCRKARILQAELESKFKKSNIPSRYCYQTFESIDRDTSMSLDIATSWLYDLVFQDWFSNDERKKKGFYLWGKVGVGKTLLACVVLNELLFRYQTNCKYAKVNKDFLDAIKRSWEKENMTSESHIQNELSTVEFLVLDDFGVHKETDWSNSQLYNLIDSRYENKKLTLITSNHSLLEWKERNESRIYSRLCQMTTEIHIEAEDYRNKFLTRLDDDDEE